MKPYGLTRYALVECPDVADIQRGGRASHVGKLQERCGVFKPYCRSAEDRARTRRYWARRARAENRSACQEE